MSFFDDVQPGEPEPPREHHPWEPPEAEFPGTVPFSTLILGQTERAAVAVTGLSAYSAGFEIFVTARVRPGGDPDAGPGGGMAGGRGPGGARRSYRFGLQLADGSRVIGQHGGPGRPGGTGAGPRRRAGPDPVAVHGGRRAALCLLAVVGMAAATRRAAGVRLRVAGARHPREPGRPRRAAALRCRSAQHPALVRGSRLTPASPAGPAQH